MIKINGKQLPNPTKYRVSIADLDSSDSARNEAGVLVRNRIRDGVTKIELGFTLRGSDVSRVLEAVQPAQVTVEYYDPRVFEYRTIQAYVGDRSNDIKMCLENTSVEDILWDVSFNLIEY